MYINSVLSFLGAWQKLQNEYPAILQEIQTSIESVDIQDLDPFKQLAPEDTLLHGFTFLGMYVKLKDSLTAFKWSYFKNSKRKINPYLFDFGKDSIGLEVSFTYEDSVLSNILSKSHFISKNSNIKIGIFMSPMNFLSRYFTEKIETFEYVAGSLTNLSPISFQNSFVLMGVSDSPSDITVRELTSEMDQFLINKIGLSLAEMKLSTEQERYDFKELPPGENRKIFHLACGMANLSGGGVMLFGVDNDGNIKGLSRGDLDQLKLRIAETIAKNCHPCPAFSFLDFDVPLNPNKCVLVVHIQELEHKPCMSDEKVYIRVGSETRPAKSEEIRRLLIR